MAKRTGQMISTPLGERIQVTLEADDYDIITEEIINRLGGCIEKGHDWNETTKEMLPIGLKDDNAVVEITEITRCKKCGYKKINKRKVIVELSELKNK